MDLLLERIEVGPWPMNCYLLRCPADNQVAIVDPGADVKTIVAAIANAPITCIMLTHGHPDHTGALEDLRQATGAPVGIHPADAEAFGVLGDFPLLDGMEVEIGRSRVKVFHTPGHTPGSVCLWIDGRVLVGDAVFPGGPGHTISPETLAQSLRSLGVTVFAWPDDTQLFPGHGTHTTVGAERAAFKGFVSAEQPPGLCGDVSWR